MDIQKDWPQIKRIFYTGFKTSGYFTVASTGPDGSPHLTPIGSLILYGPGHGIYADEFPVRLSRNLTHNPRVCVMTVSSSRKMWLMSLLKGRFTQPPGLRLYGTVGEKRPGTEEEIGNWLKRVKIFRRLKGYDLLWRNMKYVRDIRFDQVRVLSMGKMSKEIKS